ncbi:MAG: glycosyltransferase [Bacteroidetes bacterium]|nr:glycosyltransferase [Bacteroidota bacterium]
MNQKFQKSGNQDFLFTIIIPSWNNLAYLELCLRSIRNNSHFTHQVIVFVNEGNDGTLEFLDNQPDIDYVHSPVNLGVCLAMNSCRSLVKAKFMVYMNDDMYVCPDWDLSLFNAVRQTDSELFSFSSTLIEPTKTHNPNLVSVVRDYGDSISNFQESRLLAEYKDLKKGDWSGSSWPPNLFSVDVWDMVGGYSVEYTPGMYSDPDFSMKLWKLGVRHFKGIGESKVYHFGSKSTKRISKNPGSDIFLRKWGITARTFYTHWLQMGKPFVSDLPDVIDLPFATKWRNKLKKISRSF